MQLLTWYAFFCSTDFLLKLGTIDIVLRHKPDDLNAKDAEGATPLHLAVSLGRSEIVKFLLTQGGIVRRIVRGDKH